MPRVRVRVCTGLSMMTLDCCVLGRTRTYSACTVSIFSSSYIPERCLHVRPLIGRASFCSTPSLAGTQQQQQQHLHLHQQECESAAAAPTARMRRLQQPMLDVSSNISCDHVTCVSLFFNLCHPRDFTSPASRRETLYIEASRCSKYRPVRKCKNIYR